MTQLILQQYDTHKAFTLEAGGILLIRQE